MYPSWKARGDFDLLLIQSIEICLQLGQLITASPNQLLIGSPDRILQLAKRLIVNAYTAETIYSGLDAQGQVNLCILRIIGSAFELFYYEKYIGVDSDD